jgi:cyclopropane fatty-acyl-phospholipid synthase-like methyltransferase
MLNTVAELAAKDRARGDASDAADSQAALNAYFRDESSYWERIYESDGIKEAIHQERLRAALAMADGLALPPQSRVLDAGCGAGYATIALASRGLAVHALDPVEAMVRATRRRVADSRRPSCGSDRRRSCAAVWRPQLRPRGGARRAAVAAGTRQAAQ